jgi:hypothetical protein
MSDRMRSDTQRGGTEQRDYQERNVFQNNWIYAPYPTAEFCCTVLCQDTGGHIKTPL